VTAPLKSERMAWAVKLKYAGLGFAGVWFWPNANPRGVDGTAIFRTRAQAREAIAEKSVDGYPVQVRVTVELLP